MRLSVRALRSAGLSAAALGSLLLLGCPASQNWTTARTIEEGSVQHTVGVEFLGIAFDDPDCDIDPMSTACTEDLGFIAIPLPAYAIRFGVSDLLDIGGKFSASGTIGFDFKLQLVRSDAFDLAIDPGLSFISTVTYWNLPILISLNFGQSVTLTLAPKASYLLVLAGDAGGDEFLLDGLFLGGGANFQFRAGKSVAITPGFDWQTLVTEADGRLSFFSFGLGVSFGGMPQFGEQQMAALPPGQGGPGYAPAPGGGAPPPGGGAPPPGAPPPPPPGY